MENIVMLILGVFISVIGIINIMGNISTVHSYNRKRVKEEDVPKYGKAVGIGTLIIGLAIIANFILILIDMTKASPFVLIPSLVIGVGFMLYAQLKYNKGIF